MVVETKVKVGGSWKTLVGVEIKVGGAWKTVDTIEAKVAGAWKTVLESAGPGSPSGTNIVVTSSRSLPVASGCAFQSDGTIDEVGPVASARRLLGLDDNSVNHTGQWKGTIDPLVGADWEIACLSMVAGAWDFSAAALGVYINLGAERLWKEQRTIGEGAGTDTATGNFRIREIANTSNFVNFTMKGTAIKTG